MSVYKFTFSFSFLKKTYSSKSRKLTVTTKLFFYVILKRNTFAGPSSIWFGGSSGFGGNGGQAATRCVRDGPFRRGVWNVVPSADQKGCLRRQFNQSENAPNSIAVAATLRFGSSSFFDFELTLRLFLHDPIHCLIGGTYISSTCRYNHGCISWKLNA